jgi:hypothetical protein
MAFPLNVLDTIAIATPCTVPWDGMEGDDRTRFCTKCSKHVHDISELTASQAIQLLNATEQLPCVRLFRRPDGRVVTSDCPMSLRERTWKWLGRRSSWAASLFAMVFLSGCGENRQEMTRGENRQEVTRGENRQEMTLGVPCLSISKKSTEGSEVLPMPRERLLAPMPHEPMQANTNTTPSTQTSSEK